MKPTGRKNYAAVATVSRRTGASRLAASLEVQQLIIEEDIQWTNKKYIMRKGTTLKVILPQETCEEKEKRTNICRTRAAEPRRNEVVTESDIELCL